MTSGSLAEFNNQLEPVGQLITIHGKLQTGRGRRHEQDAIHRAGVVMTVAAWQAYVEKVLVEGLDAIAADIDNPVAPAPNWAKHTYKMRRASLLNAIKKFNTPNDVNVRDLFLEALDFNPWISWHWRQGRRLWDAAEMRRRTNTWVLVRHSVAHGFPLPEDVPWLQDNHGRARLTLGLLVECRRHFIHLVSQTDRAFSEHLVAHHGLAAPW